MADPVKTAATKAATPALVTITVAPRRTIQTEAEKVYGPGETLQVDATEAKRLRDLGFAEPEKAPDPAPAAKAEG